MPHVVWNGQLVLAEIHDEAVRRLKRAAIVVARHAKQLLSVAGTGVRVRDGLTKGAARKQRERKTARRARKINKIIGVGNRLARKWNKATKGTGVGKIGTIKRRFRATRAGKLTTRRKARRKRPGG